MKNNNQHKEKVYVSNMKLKELDTLLKEQLEDLLLIVECKLDLWDLLYGSKNK